MSKTRANYLAIVQAEIDDTSTGVVGLLNENISETYQDILVDTNQWITPFEEQTITCVVGQKAYTPTSKYTDILSVYYRNGADDWIKLEQISMKDYFALHVNDANSDPKYFYENAGTVNIVSPPQTAGEILVFYVPLPDELTIDTSVSIIPDKYTEVVKLGASYKYLAYDKDPAAVDYNRMYVGAKDRMIEELSTTTLQEQPPLY